MELSVERPSGAITAPAKVAATLANPVDVLWIATKTYQLQTALQAVQSLPRCIVPLLNGVDHVEILRARFGRDRVLPATIAVEAEKLSPGRFVPRSPFVNLNLALGGEQVLGPSSRDWVISHSRAGLSRTNRRSCGNNPRKTLMACGSQGADLHQPS